MRKFAFVRLSWPQFQVFKMCSRVSVLVVWWLWSKWTREKSLMYKRRRMSGWVARREWSRCIVAAIVKHVGSSHVPFIPHGGTNTPAPWRPIPETKNNKLDLWSAITQNIFTVFYSSLRRKNCSILLLHRRERKIDM